jgi:hypothetical protein
VHRCQRSISKTGASAGHGLALNGQPLINPGGATNQPIFFGRPTAQQLAAPTPFKLARKVQVSSGSPFVINVLTTATAGWMASSIMWAPQ